MTGPMGNTTAEVAHPRRLTGASLGLLAWFLKGLATLRVDPKDSSSFGWEGLCGGQKFLKSTL